MAEFEHQDDAATPLEWMLPAGRPLPSDFTADEVTLAQSLQTHFDIAGENLPPRYAQTLLGDPRHAPASDDFEERTITSVFQALHLERPSAAAALVSVPRTARHTWRQLVQRTKGVVQRSAVGLMALLMVLAYNTTGTGVALASVLQLVVGRGGVQSVVKYPALSPAQGNYLPHGRPTLEFVPQWTGANFEGYTFMGLDMYPARWWSAGAIAVLHYRKSDDQGTHELSFLEFKPNVQVALQVVQDGAATNVQLSNDSGVFVSGKWIYVQGQPVWQPGSRAEIICHSPEDDGVVIWIAADNISADGQDAAHGALVDAANGLQMFALAEAEQTPLGLHYAITYPIGKEESFNGDVMALEANPADPKHQTIYIKLDLTTINQPDVVRDAS